MRSKKAKVNNSEKIYNSDELNLAMEIEFHGGHRLNSIFKTYRIVSKSREFGKFYDVLEENNVLEDLEQSVRNLNVGQSYFDIIGSAGIVFIKSYDINKKKYYTEDEIRVVIEAVHPDMYFENAKKPLMLIKK